MKEITFVKTKYKNENVCSFDGKYFYIYNAYEDQTYKFDEKANILYNLLDKRMTITNIVNHFKSLFFWENDDVNFTENDLFDMLQVFVENALLTSENVEI